VAEKIGPIAKPANIVFTPELPKTRSGKIMRRLLRDVAENRPLGDTTTLADPTVVEEIKERSATGSDGEELHPRTNADGARFPAGASGVAASRDRSQGRHRSCAAARIRSTRCATRSTRGGPGWPESR
jgi:hypothetical protein